MGTGDRGWGGGVGGRGGGGVGRRSRALASGLSGV